MPKVRVSIPATSANLGPGFDCMGLALSLHNHVEVRTLGHGFLIEIDGEGSEHLPRDETNHIARGAFSVFDRVGSRPPGLHIISTNHIPAGSGLGSSATALVGGVVAANWLLGEPLGRDEMLNLVVELEGHPDNVSAALLGGLTVSSFTEDGLAVRRVPVAPMQVVVVMPDVQTSTREMRATLPTTVSFPDAVANIGRALLVSEALRDGDFDLLGAVMHDRLHEPYRRKHIPGFQQVVNAAYAARASSVAISGAGPSIIAFAPAHHEAIQEAMIAAFRDKGSIRARGWVLPVEMQGARVTIEAD